jgi:aldehyde:ferredoxin oxidoreductase
VIKVDRGGIAMYKGGYAGKILRINLTTQKATEEALPEPVVKDYLGGAGFARKDDSLPKRLMTEAIKEGNSKGQVITQADLDEMLDEYYAVRGWDKAGTPTPAKLKELNIKG